MSNEEIELQLSAHTQDQFDQMKAYRLQELQQKIAQTEVAKPANMKLLTRDEALKAFIAQQESQLA